MAARNGREQFGSTPLWLALILAIAFMVAFVAERRADSADAVDARRTAARGHVAERVTDAPAHGADQIAALGPGFDSV